MNTKQNLIDEIVILLNETEDNTLLEVIKNLLILQAH